MTSTQKLIKGTGGNVYINLERPNSSGLNHNERSSTSNSNYYNQTLTMTENPSLSTIQQTIKTEKRRKTSNKKNHSKEINKGQRKESNMTPTRSAKNFSPIMHYGKYCGIQNAASPKHLRVTNRH